MKSKGDGQGQRRNNKNRQTAARTGYGRKED